MVTRTLSTLFIHQRMTGTQREEPHTQHCLLTVRWLHLHLSSNYHHHHSNSNRNSRAPPTRVPCVPILLSPSMISPVTTTQVPYLLRRPLLVLARLLPLPPPCLLLLSLASCKRMPLVKPLLPIASLNLSPLSPPHIRLKPLHTDRLLLLPLPPNTHTIPPVSSCRQPLYVLIAEWLLH